MSKTYVFISHVEHNHLLEVADILHTHANPDVSFSGVMPLHLAVEEGFVDMAAYLLHWGASKEAVDGFRRTPLIHAQLRAKNKRTKDDPNNETLIKLLTDEPFRKKYVEDLLLRMVDMREARRLEFRAARKQQAILFALIAFVVFAGVHVALLYYPDYARQYMSEAHVRTVWAKSPILKRLQHLYTPPGAARAAAAAAGGAEPFDEL